MMGTKLYLWAILGSALLAVVPFIALWVLNGPYTIPPEFMDDSGYYYARMEAVVHGFPLIGNPYFKEHANGTAASFFGADWIAAAPLAVGVPLLPAAILNTVLWMGALSALCIVLFRRLGLSIHQAVLGSVATTLSLFWYMERPVAMQIVYPSFVFLLYTYAAWLAQPTSKMRGFLLGLSAGLTFYLYTYEWQITVLIFFFTHVLLIRNWQRYKLLLAIDVGVLGLALPMLLYTAHELANPFYWESVHRIGYIHTHTFGSAAVIVLCMLALGALCLALMRERLGKWRMEFFGLSGVSIGIASVSNVITGKDLETAVHIGRFMDFWSVCLAWTFICLGVPWSTATIRTRLASFGAAVLLAATLIPSIRMTARINPDARTGEQYVPVLDWLRLNTEPGSVVLASDAMAYYIPVETRDYTLFQPDGGLYLLPDAELTERYLASRLATTTDLARIKTEYRAYAGVGNAVHAFKIYNREVAICQILRWGLCGASVPSAQVYRGEPYFLGLWSQYQMMQKDPSFELGKFQVRYIVIQEGEILPPSLQKVTTRATSVGGYTIYVLSPA